MRPNQWFLVLVLALCELVAGWALMNFYFDKTSVLYGKGTHQVVVHSDVLLVIDKPSMARFVGSRQFEVIDPKMVVNSTPGIRPVGFRNTCSRSAAVKEEFFTSGDQPIPLLKGEYQIRSDCSVIAELVASDDDFNAFTRASGASLFGVGVFLGLLGFVIFGFGCKFILDIL